MVVCAMFTQFSFINNLKNTMEDNLKQGQAQ